MTIEESGDALNHTERINPVTESDQECEDWPTGKLTIDF